MTQGLLFWHPAYGRKDVSGGNVTKWYDMTGKGFDWTLPNASPPALIASAQNGRPALHFSSAWMQLATNPFSGSSGEIFSCMKTNDVAGVSTLAPWKWGTAASTNCYTFLGDDKIYDDFCITTRPGGTGGNPARAYGIYNAWFDSGNSASFLNAVACIPSAAATPGFAANPSLGCDGAFSGDVSFMGLVGFNRKLSTAERASMNAWMKADFATP